MKIKIIALLLLPYIMWSQDKLVVYKKQALEQNLKLKSLFLEYKSALEKVPQLGALPDPKLAFGYFISPVETRLGPQQAKISFSQMFPWFGVLGTKENIATQQAKVKFEKFNEYKNEIIFKIEQKWFQLCEMNTKIKLTNENIKILKTFEKLAFKKYETAKIEMVDILRIQIMKDDMNDKITSLRDNLQILKIKFNRFLNRDKDSIILIDENFYVQERIKDKENFDQNPKLKMVNHLLLVQKEMEILASKQYYPNWGIKLDYTFIAENNMPNGGRDVFMPMVSFTIPFFFEKIQSKKTRSNFKTTYYNAKTIRYKRGIVIRVL